MSAYQDYFDPSHQLVRDSVRRFVERELLPAMARAGALRFWLSRLWAFYLPREASMLKAHDPTHFERILRQRMGAPLVVGSIFATPMTANYMTTPTGLAA